MEIFFTLVLTTYVIPLQSKNIPLQNVALNKTVISVGVSKIETTGVGKRDKYIIVYMTF